MADKTLEERLASIEEVLININKTLTGIDDMNKMVLSMVTFNPDEEADA